MKNLKMSISIFMIAASIVGMAAAKKAVRKERKKLKLQKLKAQVVRIKRLNMIIP